MLLPRFGADLEFTPDANNEEVYQRTVVTRGVLFPPTRTGVFEFSATQPDLVAKNTGQEPMCMEILDDVKLLFVKKR